MESNLTPYQAVPLIECRAAIVFAPHPDDETLGCGGLLAAYAAAAIPVRVIIVTSGDYGEHGKAGAGTRENESRTACSVLGIHNLDFWREPDRGVACDERTVRKAMKDIQRADADLVLTPSIHEIHPDHRATAWIAIEAVRRLVEAGHELRVAMYEIGHPLHRIDALVDITPYARLKQEAVDCYASQLDIQPYDEVILALNRYRTYTLPATVTMAEAYAFIDAQMLRQPALIAESELHRQERLGLTTVPMPEAIAAASFSQRSQ